MPVLIVRVFVTGPPLSSPDEDWDGPEWVEPSGTLGVWQEPSPRLVKLTTEDPTLRVCYEQVHDEGHTDTRITWTLVEDEAGPPYVRREWRSSSSDCDGRYSQTRDSKCPISDLFSRIPSVFYEGRHDKEPLTPDEVPYRIPTWTEIDHSFRDHQAEAAGY